MMIKLADKSDCTGCKACRDVCPVNAIEFDSDTKGFWYPFINQELCTKCGKCRKACVVLKTNQKDLQKTMPVVYSAYSKQNIVREKSTSGGLFYELAAQFIRNGGIVCGCRYSDDYRTAFHSFAENLEELELLLNSKYFQSDTNGIYKKIQSILRSGRSVMFCGAPCQSAALQQYLSGELIDNLLSVDWVCRGINSPMGYQKFLDELEKQYRSRITKVRFKEKKRGWYNLGTRVTFENGKEYYGNRYTDSWINSYLAGNFMIRSSCAVCRFKEIPRISDITLGDFWGASYTPDERKRGVSLVMINSSKGKAAFESIKCTLVIKEAELDRVTYGNPQIKHCVVLNEMMQDVFFRRIEHEKFSQVVWSMLNKSVLQRYTAWYSASIKQIIRDFINSR